MTTAEAEASVNAKLDEAMESWKEMKEWSECVSQTKSKAKLWRGAVIAKEELSTEYRKAKRENPSLNRNKYAREISDKIVMKVDPYAQYRGALYGEDPAKTLRGWFKESDKLMSSPDTAPDEILATLAKDCTIPKKA